ncbi:MAG: hypothetical protein ACLSS1_02370 [Eubacterium sp.]|jgi:hypothetical protein|uniref:DNA-directed RNA polymerase n=1 Tax=Siphoviridae sp. ctLR131 TaxID=2826250 RepID=A0A8S5MPJ0_9CAUD|nr:MAG TPA: DNA-directed RNA polymerase [Siphoviridae sp. ctLR131]
MTTQEALDYFIRRKAQLGISDKIQQAETLAISALEKQIPKKPILKEYGFFGPYPFCPWCDNALINTRNDSWHKEKFCPNCGHALKRSENND